jgi:hypothetical protein
MLAQRSLHRQTRGAKIFQPIESWQFTLRAVFCSIAQSPYMTSDSASRSHITAVVVKQVPIDIEGDPDRGVTHQSLEYFIAS